MGQLGIKVGFEATDDGELSLGDFDDGFLFDLWGKSEWQPLYLAYTERIETTCRTCHVLDGSLPRRRIQKDIHALRNQTIGWANTNDVVLMNAVRDFAQPQCTSTNLSSTPVALHDEDIARNQAEFLQFIRRQLEAMQIREIK